MIGNEIIFCCFLEKAESFCPEIKWKFVPELKELNERQTLSISSNL